LVRTASSRLRREISEADAREIVDQARTTARPRTPDAWARALGLKYEVRQAIGISTTGAIDVNKRERARRRKLKDRQRAEQRRRERGVRPLSQSYSRTQPWKEKGYSRSTWERERRRKRALVSPPDATTSAALTDDATMSAALFPNAVDAVASPERGKRDGPSEGGCPSIGNETE